MGGNVICRMHNEYRAGGETHGLTDQGFCHVILTVKYLLIFFTIHNIILTLFIGINMYFCHRMVIALIWRR